jgi:hypothetical protein
MVADDVRAETRGREGIAVRRRVQITKELMVEPGRQLAAEGP